MTTLLFDTHKAFKALQEAGFDDAQAEAVVVTIGTALIGNVATKQDLMGVQNEVQTLGNDLRSEIQTQDSDLRSEIQAQGNALRSEMQAMGSDLRSEIQTQGNDLRSEMQAMGNDLRSEIQTQGSDLRSEIQTQGSGLRSEMQAMELRMTLRMGGLIVAGVGLIVALDKFL